MDFVLYALQTFVEVETLPAFVALYLSYTQNV